MKKNTEKQNEEETTLKVLKVRTGVKAGPSDPRNQWPHNITGPGPIGPATPVGPG